MSNEKIVYGCYPSFFSTLVANILVVEKKIPLSCIMVSSRSIKIDKVKITGIKGIRFLKERFSYKFLFFHLMISSVIPVIYLIQCFFSGRGFYSIKKICAKYDIQYVESDNFNKDVNVCDGIDVFLSMCLDQRLDKSFIDRSKKLCINIHPSDLPNFGGVEPLIMFLLSQENYMGISIHKMTPVFDEGVVVSRKYVERGDKSYFSLMVEFIRVGTDMFYEVYKKKWNCSDLKQIKQKYPYRSWPTKAEISEFEKKYSYLATRDLLEINKILNEL